MCTFVESYIHTSVMLNAVLRPMMSAVMGQSEEPITRPTYLATMIIEIWETANSF